MKYRHGIELEAIETFRTFLSRRRGPVMIRIAPMRAPIEAEKTEA